jgi:hypothetical protein
MWLLVDLMLDRIPDDNFGKLNTTNGIIGRSPLVAPYIGT